MRLQLIFVLSSSLLLNPTLASSQPCVNHEQTRLPSPDGTRELVSFIRLCGTAYTGEKAIVTKGAPLPDGPGNVTLPGHPVRTVARWATTDTVIIASPAAGPSPREFRVNGVTVRYVRE